MSTDKPLLARVSELEWQLPQLVRLVETSCTELRSHEAKLAAPPTSDLPVKFDALQAEAMPHAR